MGRCSGPSYDSGGIAYFLPSALTAQLLGRLGVPAAAMEVTGIPVRAEIAAPKAPAALRTRHHLPPDGPLISLFGAGVEPRRVRRPA